jgi:deazaflavin-dependent oxidoreductase (nitroreductase family)
MTESKYITPDMTYLGESHIQVYRETDGETGYLWNGVPSLLLTTTGRKSGLERTSPLIFTYHRDDFLVVASQGGAPVHPNWYFNLLGNPKANVQIKAEKFDVIARTATDEEKPELWEAVTTNWPNYDLYQSRTDRPIPVVILSRDHG